MSTPFFSIVIPTRNRSDLLRRALHSALWQRFGDFEVVVFDNASADDTPNVVREFKNPRIRYFRPQTWLIPQVAFEEAYKVAQGQFLHTIGDDDALLPHAWKERSL